MQTLYKLNSRLKGIKANGLLLNDVIIFDEIKKLALEELEQEHAKQYLGLDDDMPDDFSTWLGEKMEEDPMLATLID